MYVVFQAARMKNRSRYEVIAAILKSVNKEETRTKIMYKAFLSFPQLKEYLGVLLEKGLLEHDATVQQYRTTDKGKQYLKMYRDVGQMIFPHSIKKK